MSRINVSNNNRITSSPMNQDDPYFGTPQKSIDLDDGSANGSCASSIRRSSSVPRRQSFGGSGLLSRNNSATNLKSTETPIRDRRAMLEAWRKAKGGETVCVNGEDAASVETRKRTRGDPPPLPPSSKQHRTTLSQDQTSTEGSHSLYPNYRPTEGHSQTPARSYHTIDYIENDGENRVPFTVRTPSRFRGTMGSARRKSLLGQNIYHQNEEEPLSQLTQEVDNETSFAKQGAIDSVEDAGLLSQMERMKQRVEQLEKEKMDLSMSKAPLEARFRQKEDAWQKEKSSLLDQIEDSKASLRESDERYRDLQEQYEQASAEMIHLRQELRKASSSRATTDSSSINSSLWSRQLQNDRDLTEMKEKVRAAEEEISGIRLAKVSLEKELHATRIELSCLERNYDELKAEYDEIAAHTSENNEAEIKLRVLTEEHIATTAALNAVYADLDATKAQAVAAMKEKENSHKKEIEQLKFDLSVMKTRASKVQPDVDTSMQVNEEEDEAVLRARIEERDKRIAELEAELLNGEQLRRQMHNTIQELRGNIRVYVRTRPFLPGDKQNDESPVDVSPDGESLTILDRRSGSPIDFKFDKVFPPSAGQELVFEEVSDFVQSALDGYHVCLFSYGQTGSGKTHTMQGCGNGPMRGIIPRAVEKILDQARSLNQHKWNFTVSASFLEIYNEDLKDLLISMKSSKGSSSSEKLSIKRNREGRSYVDGLAQIPIDVNDPLAGMQQLDALMGVAARSRSVASTKMNSQSSRSHSVFMLHLNGFNEESGATVNGALNLCDLAGSERLDRSGAGADAVRLRETQSINKSLSCLGDVFNALATGASHVPYRNSKLTYLLQDCLSGDGKALMFVNLSPTTASCGESVCSLRFAQRVNQVELGKATKHIEYGGKGKR
ncbi:kinesin motor domain containing protein [Nitzschia inconspicua]|uniref:Kinesin motor domain containing protein n=1 Tax=Nitzschia inconspicua TaxID=303405 RepID=A0A9K3K806_9STRA|nr:kinesin motor domain containing protein [Nitzschia inconspicua]KAG7340477.1 kinesin motor domain containing protein [Nitzschia inconspicua]